MTFRNDYIILATRAFGPVKGTGVLCSVVKEMPGPSFDPSFEIHQADKAFLPQGFCATALITLTTQGMSHHFGGRQSVTNQSCGEGDACWHHVMVC